MNQPNGASTEVESSRSILGVSLPAHLLGRLYFLFAIVIFQLLFCFQGRGVYPGHLKFFGANTDVYSQIPIFTYAVFLGFGHFRLKSLQEKISFGRILFACHLLCMAVVLSFTVAARERPGWVLFDTSGYVKSAFYLLGTALLALACVPFRSWMAAIHATGRLWFYAILAGVAGWWLGSPIKLLWGATMTAQSGMMQRATLRTVGAVLGHFLPDLVSDPATFTIGTSRYSIVIAGGCSGVEGLGLVLIFTSL